MDANTKSRVGSAIRVERDTKRFGIARAAYTDPDILSAEMVGIFATCWLYVGHSSELKDAGAFKTRTISGRPLIFLKDKQSQIRCFLNVCPPRGAQICRLREGSARSFSCIYHGWTFENT